MRAGAHKGFFGRFPGGFRKILGLVEKATTRYWWTGSRRCGMNSRSVKRALWLARARSLFASSLSPRAAGICATFSSTGASTSWIADCYSRMTRAAIDRRRTARLIIRHHDFENWPHGITPHTTAPLDWLIVAGKRIAGLPDFGLRIPGGTSVLRGQTLDLSGALISPLLGVLACGWLAVWAWARRGFARSRGTVAAALRDHARSLVHGTLLGRPDHQSLLILLLADGARRGDRGWRGERRTWPRVGRIAARSGASSAASAWALASVGVAL